MKIKLTYCISIIFLICLTLLLFFNSCSYPKLNQETKASLKVIEIELEIREPVQETKGTEIETEVEILVTTDTEPAPEPVETLPETEPVEENTAYV